MEVIGTLILLYGGWYILQVVLGMLGQGAVVAGRAAKKAITGKETYFGPPELMIEEGQIPDSTLKLKRVKFRGRVPVLEATHVSYVISAFDATDGTENLKPVLSLVDSAQETDTIAYQRSGIVGDIDLGVSITDWSELGILIPELLQPAYSGERSIMVVVRMYQTGITPEIRGGFRVTETPLIWTDSVAFDYEFEEKGYEEVSKHREESQALSLKIGVAIAMADGSLDDAEGEVLKSWIIKEISGFSEEKQSALKKLFNSSLSEGFSEAERGELVLSDLTNRLQEIGDKKSKYAAIGLCFDIMAADGVAAPEEMVIIRNIAESLDLDMDEIEKMREEVTLNLSSSLTSEKGLEALVGIEEDWDDAKKKKHLRLEFQKWSNRLNSLPDGDGRDSAQEMLDTIASLRQKYD